MENIESYRQRFYNLMESTMGDVKPLINEQGIKPQPSPNPKPKPDINPKPKPDIKPQPKPDIKPQPAPKPKPEPQPKPEPRPEPQPNPNPKPQNTKEIIVKLFPSLPNRSIFNDSFLYDFPNNKSVQIYFDPQVKNNSIKLKGFVLPKVKLIDGRRLKEMRSDNIEIELKADGSNLTQAMSYIKDGVNKLNKQRVRGEEFKTKDYGVTTSKDVPYQGDEISLD